MNRNDIKDDTKPMSLLSLILSFMALFVISACCFSQLRLKHVKYLSAWISLYAAFFFYN
ncbi:cAMP-dependent Kef-type K+ transport system [Vibrio ponticus]|nr:cAMP-dependent Kef-type K+ transport system [Vibrio ponticus]